MAESKQLFEQFNMQISQITQTFTQQFRQTMITVMQEYMEHGRKDDDLVDMVLDCEEEKRQEIQLEIQLDDSLIVPEVGADDFHTKIEDPNSPIHQVRDEFIHDKVSILPESDFSYHYLVENFTVGEFCINNKDFSVANKVFGKIPKRKGYMDVVNPEPPDGFDQVTHGGIIAQLDPTTIKLGAIVLPQKNEQELLTCVLNFKMYSVDGRMLVSIIKKGPLFGIPMPYGIEACKVFDEMCRRVLISGYADEVCMHIMTDLHQPMYNDSGGGTRIPLFEGAHNKLTTVSRTTSSTTLLWQYHTLVGLKQPMIEVKLNEGREYVLWHILRRAVCYETKVLKAEKGFFNGLVKVLDGWFHTGDVGEWQSDGLMKIIDRQKNIFNLSQEEYVAMENIESTYSQCSLVTANWVCDNSFESFIVVVVILERKTLKDWAMTNNVSGDFELLCKNGRIKFDPHPMIIKYWVALRHAESYICVQAVGFLPLIEAIIVREESACHELGAKINNLEANEHRVMTVSPRYDQYNDAWETKVIVELKAGDKTEMVRFFHYYKRGVDRVFVDHLWFLEKAAFEARRVLNLNCNEYFSGPYGEDVVFIANDWHTALIPCYLKSMYQSKGIYASAKVAFCIHNIAYQGRFAFMDIALLNLPHEFRSSFDFIDGYDKPVKGRKINWLKVGIIESDIKITVSPYYAKELVSGEDKGVELDNNLRNEGIIGIVNGMDVQEWNPLTDKYTNVKYDATIVMDAKPLLKEELQAEVGFPVIGFIGKLEEQKGSDILAATFGNTDVNPPCYFEYLPP